MNLTGDTLLTIEKLNENLKARKTGAVNINLVCRRPQEQDIF